MRLSLPAILLVAICACSESSEEQHTILTSTPGIRINEVMLANTRFPSADGKLGPWVEIVNDGSETVALDELTLITDGVQWRMPDVDLAPKRFFVLQALTSTDRSLAGFLVEEVGELSIVTGSELVVDRVTLPPIPQDESYGRYPDGTGAFSVYPAGRVSFDDRNPDPGYIVELASETELRPRDSSPNAILRYDGAYYILGGWSNFGDGLWYSVADVWKSTDAIRWELVNPAPPYDPYSSYVVWDGRMWALGPISASSTDGVTWNPEKLTAPLANRAVVFGDMLVSIYGQTVVGTTDGDEWSTLTSSAPWAARAWPAVVVYRGRIWLIGGASDYGTPTAKVYNDVWSSADGVTWQSEVESANWTPRYWTSAIVLDDKIFLIGGANLSLWTDEFGNTAEIWYTDDGTEWLELESENKWQPRHASLTVQDDAGGMLLIGGYGHGGSARIYNDVWKLRASIYFPKLTGALHDLGTWGRNFDGSGASPQSFQDDNQIFVLANRPDFVVDERWSVSGAGSRIFVGDGNRDTPVLLEVRDANGASQPLYLYADSTTLVSGKMPQVYFRDPEAKLIVLTDPPS